MLHGEHSAILSAFIKLLLSIKAFVLSILKWPLKTGFTVNLLCNDANLIIQRSVLLIICDKYKYFYIC